MSEFTVIHSNSRFGIAVDFRFGGMPPPPPKKEKKENKKEPKAEEVSEEAFVSAADFTLQLTMVMIWQERGRFSHVTRMSDNSFSAVSERN